MSVFIVLFVCIFLSGITAETPNRVRLGSDHQRVHLVNRYRNAHLSVSNPMDPIQRGVYLGNLSDNDYAIKEWRLVPFQNGSYFEIIHHQYNEPLCAVPAYLGLVEFGRYVVTWMPGPYGKQCLWDIQLAPEGHYLIKNVKYREYMFAVAYPSNMVFLWRSYEAYNQYFWDIININV